jgi:aminopeptidase N
MRRALLLSLLVALPLAAQRLSPDVAPSHYTIALDVDLAGRRFSGEETIEVTTRAQAPSITLNALGLTISRASIDGTPATVETNARDEQITLVAAAPLPAGKHTLALAWSGTLSDTNLRGLYISKTARREYGASQFEGTYARLMFPSFDEPSFKATFDLSVTVDAGDTAISNGRIVRDEPAGEGRHRISFSTSPLMSTYLVAVAIGDFRCVSATEAGVPIRVCSIPEKLEETRFALEAARASLRYYQEWFSIRYPFGKLDLVAIPDYEWGGMENTASIFFRERALLLPANASPAARQDLAGLVSHEIAHQWFGDLVTPAWWDDIWLNEGFATWIAPKPVAAWRSDWNTATGVAKATQTAITLDTLRASRPIHATASTPAEIKEMFDGIAYQKGAALLRMLEAYVGAETFRTGVNAYLSAHANGDATSGDFAAALAKASGKPVDAIMRTFVTQQGVPLVTFEHGCENGRGRVTLRQQRFTSGAAGVPLLWSIPVCVKLAGGTRCELLSTEQSSFETEGCPAWLFGNADAVGYYRSDYREPLPRRAVAALTAPERIALVEDAWAMVRASRGGVDRFLDVAAALEGEVDLGVISSLATSLGAVRSELTASSLLPYFDRWMRATFTPSMKVIGWTPAADEPDERRLARAALLELLGTSGDPAARRLARGIVERTLAGSPHADTALADAAFRVASAAGDPALYARFAERFANASSNADYQRFLYALIDFPQRELAERTLGVVTGGKVRINDYASAFSALLVNPATRDAAWSHMKAHWPELRTQVVSFGGRGAVQALGSFCTPELRDDVRSFFAANEAPGAERAVAQSIERIDACVALRASQSPVVSRWLELRLLH